MRYFSLCFQFLSELTHTTCLRVGMVSTFINGSLHFSFLSGKFFAIIICKPIMGVNSTVPVVSHITRFCTKSKVWEKGFPVIKFSEEKNGLQYAHYPLLEITGVCFLVCS